MARKEIRLSDLVDALDSIESEYADFFRPMLGYEAVLKLYEGIEDSVEPLINELEDETSFECPPDLLAFYMNTNGGTFGDLELYAFSDKNNDYTIHRLNVLNKDLKQSIGLDNSSILVGKYTFNDNYVIVKLEDGKYVYQLYDGKAQQPKMNFEYLIQLVALEVSYVTDYDGFMDFEDEE